jgi:hypothetical protein
MAFHILCHHYATGLAQARKIHILQCMKTITVNVSEPAYLEFQNHARELDRTTAELIREAMEEFRQRHMVRATSLREVRPVSVGGPVAALGTEDDVLGEMLDDTRD